MSVRACVLPARRPPPHPGAAGILAAALAAACALAFAPPASGEVAAAPRARDGMALHVGVECVSLRMLSSSLTLPDDRWMPGVSTGVSVGRAGRWEVAVDGLLAETTSRSRGTTVSGRQVERARGLWLSPRVVIGSAGGWSVGPRVGYLAAEVERDADPLNRRVSTYLRTAEIAVAGDLARGPFGAVRLHGGIGAALGASSTASPRIEHDWSGPFLRLGLGVALGRSSLATGGAGTRSRP